MKNYKGCLFDENGAFHPENIIGVDSENESLVSGFKTDGPFLLEQFSVCFRSNPEAMSFEDDLDNGSARTGIHDLDEYVVDTMYVESRADYYMDNHLPLPKPDNIFVVIERKGDKLELTDTVLYFNNDDYGDFGEDCTCYGYFDLDKFTEAEKQGIVDFALETANKHCGLSKDEIMDRLVDRSKSSYYKLIEKAELLKGDDPDDSLPSDDRGIGDE